MGTENSSIRDMQRFLRGTHNDVHAGDKSFVVGRSTSNQRIESWWGFLRRECVEFWLDLFHRLKDEGHFDADLLDKNLMLFCFLGLIQDELDSTKEVWNSHLIRPSKNERVPHGRPHAMFMVPELYGTQDFLCQVGEEDFMRCEGDCIHRNDVACDADVLTLCTHIMAQNNLQVPVDGYMAMDNYLYLRDHLKKQVDIPDPERKNIIGLTIYYTN
ncbi:uncharacterized protein LOC133482721 [Phyllopteryx taeniolatus]|uniref:uncharacterized protein LOC133482721 n=1 Tax=Phyllopteryx taeniolatus TaxID=161469 RepID=UPI002AD4F7E3|nr:uncharacterized protein LOC133482721 [Phyllopteryx taeniolatus]